MLTQIYTNHMALLYHNELIEHDDRDAMYLSARSKNAL